MAINWLDEYFNSFIMTETSYVLGHEIRSLIHPNLSRNTMRIDVCLFNFSEIYPIYLRYTPWPTAIDKNGPTPPKHTF